MAKRAASNTNPHESVDLTVPINKQLIDIPAEGCFSREWDMGSPECPVCAMNDICGILFQDVVNKKVKEVEAKHTTFLDKTDFKNIDTEALLKEIRENNGVVPVEFFATHIKKTANTADDVAVLEWIKRFKAEHNLKFRGGKIWTA